MTNSRRQVPDCHLSLTGSRIVVRTLFARRAALCVAAGFIFLGFGTFLSQAAEATIPALATSTTCSSPPKTAVLTAAFVSNNPADVSPSASASPSDTPVPSTSPSPSPADTSTPPASPTPSPSSDSTSTSPSPDPSTSPVATPTATPTPTPTTTATPTPTVSRTTPPPQQVTRQLCVLVQSSTSSAVQPGGQATFTILVWSTNGGSTGVSVTASMSPAPAIGKPRFTACPAARGATCAVGGLPAGRADELVATVPVPSNAAVGQLVELTALASAARSLSYASTATDVVMPTPTGTGSVNLPFAGFLPSIAGTGVNATDPAALFPTVGSSGGTVPVDQSAVGSSVLQASTDASAVPFGGQLRHVELIALIVILGAVIVAVVHVSLRTPRPAQPAAPGAADQLSEQKPDALRRRQRLWVRAPWLRARRR